MENNPIEKIAEESERKIMRFTNIDSEDFTHSFRGISITIQKGHSYVGRLPEVDHLAIHLARKILSREKKAKMPANDSKGVQLFNDKEIAELKQKILSFVAEEQPERVTAEQARKEDIENLENKYEKKEIPIVTPDDVTKKDVIKDLESRGVKVDVSKSKEELLEQLMELESKGE